MISKQRRNNLIELYVRPAIKARRDEFYTELMELARDYELTGTPVPNPVFYVFEKYHNFNVVAMYILKDQTYAVLVNGIIITVENAK